MGLLSVYGAATLFGAAVHGLAFPEPSVTGTVIIPLDAQSPKPTAPPMGHELLRRAGGSTNTRSIVVAPDNICGYFSGREGAPLSCIGTTNSCVFATSTGISAGFAGCCDDVSCGVVITCLDMNDMLTSSNCDNGCLMDTFTLKCTSTARPYCNTLSFFGGITDYFCNSVNISSPQDVETTYIGQTDRFLSTMVITLDGTTSDIFTDIISSTKPVPSTTKPDPTPPPVSSTGPVPPPTTSAVSGSSSAPIGPIVGGVVGGVAVIGLVVLGIIFLMKRKSSAPGGVAAAATPGEGGPSPPIMAGMPIMPGPGSPPPPNDNKTGHQQMVEAYTVVTPNNGQGYPQQYQQQPQFQQQYSPPQAQGYFAPGQQQGGSPEYNRLSIAQPASPVSSLISQQPGTYQHMSQQSYSSSPPGGSPFQQGATMGNVPPPQQQQEVYEVSGHGIGGDPNPDHRGQIHQLQ